MFALFTEYDRTGLTAQDVILVNLDHLESAWPERVGEDEVTVLRLITGTRKVTTKFKNLFRTWDDSKDRGGGAFSLFDLRPTIQREAPELSPIVEEAARIDMPANIKRLSKSSHTTFGKTELTEE